MRIKLGFLNMDSIEKERQKNPSEEALQVIAAAKACFKGEISLKEFQKLQWMKLNHIVSSWASDQENKAENKSTTSAEQLISVKRSNGFLGNEIAKCSEADEKCLMQSARLLIQRLGQIADPLQEIYPLGAQIFDDLFEVISEKEYDKLFVFRLLADEETQVVDNAWPMMPTTTAEADDLRRQIRDAVSNYLSRW
jgi:hypothetical protein